MRSTLRPASTLPKSNIIDGAEAVIQNQYMGATRLVESSYADQTKWKAYHGSAAPYTTDYDLAGRRTLGGVYKPDGTR